MALRWYPPPQSSFCCQLQCQNNVFTCVRVTPDQKMRVERMTERAAKWRRIQEQKGQESLPNVLVMDSEMMARKKVVEATDTSTHSDVGLQIDKTLMANQKVQTSIGFLPTSKRQFFITLMKPRTYRTNKELSLLFRIKEPTVYNFFLLPGCAPSLFNGMKWTFGNPESCQYNILDMKEYGSVNLIILNTVKARYNDTHYTDKFTYRQLFGRNQSATLLKAPYTDKIHGSDTDRQNAKQMCL
ncbi:hypothetical protein CAPTEDRAFT_210369 [Capitella teleta]|uniref:Transposase Helix-turn-helix domain-containing protein n=1 Tax=Capitella teleta TaxID=283909 RepID=N1PB80_CAPTE|nr:hypothetical protein CAPTEDRAFT_210369 [Capitella teleta]|eukprot:ELU18891.1 hypothetical protein CAPTEDRAFT_210369 [Capitella teleta]